MEITLKKKMFKDAIKNKHINDKKIYNKYINMNTLKIMEYFVKKNN